MIAALKGPGEVEAEIRMTRTLFTGAFLIVEGDHDSRFFRPRVRPGECEIVIAGGKPALVGGISRLDTDSFQGTVGVIDDDCDSLEGVALTSKNVIRTETRDLESLLLRTKALDKGLAEFGDARRIQAFESKEGMCVRDALLKRALPFGRLRWYSRRKGGGLSFKKLAPERFADETRWTFDFEALFVVACSEGLSPSPIELKREMAALPSIDPWLLCQGMTSWISYRLDCARRLARESLAASGLPMCYAPAPKR